MKKGRIFGALVLFLMPVLLWAGLASAQTFRSGDTAIVPADETVNSTLFANGRTIDVAGEIDGDLICAGVNINVTGNVRGDVICAGQTININGTVQGDVRLAGQTVTIGGRVLRSASVAASAFSLDSDARIGDDLSVAGSDIVLNGRVGRDTALAGATTTLNGEIGRNVNASVQDLNLRGQADVGGGLYYTSAMDASLDEGAQVAGETIRSEPTETKGTFEAPFVSGVGFVLYLIAALLVLSLALVALFPVPLHRATDLAVKQPLKVLLTGIVAGLAVPAVIIVLMATFIGIPLALLLLGIWLLVLFLAGPVFSYYVGRLLLSTSKNPFLIMALGALVVLLLLFVPILGFLVWLAAMWMGAGMLLLEFTRRAPRPQYEVAASKK